MMNAIPIFRGLTLFGYFGLMSWIFSWHLWINPLPPEFISLTLLMQLGPLMFPLKGILNARAYTHAWSSYLALFYFVVGIWHAAVPAGRVFGSIICLFSLIFFIGAIFFARYQGKANKAAIEQNNLNPSGVDSDNSQ